MLCVSNSAYTEANIYLLLITILPIYLYKCILQVSFILFIYVSACVCVCVIVSVISSVCVCVCVNNVTTSNSFPCLLFAPSASGTGPGRLKGNHQNFVPSYLFKIAPHLTYSLEFVLKYRSVHVCVSACLFVLMFVVVVVDVVVSESYPLVSFTVIRQFLLHCVHWHSHCWWHDVSAAGRS